MALKLPQVEIKGPGINAPLRSPEHIRRDFARRDAEFTRADLENYKKYQNLEIFPPQQLILHSPNGGSWPVIVNDGGQITAKGGPPWLAEAQYAELTSDYTVTTTSTAIISLPAQVVPDGYVLDAFIDIYIPAVDAGNNTTFTAMLRINGTDQGIIAFLDPKGAAAEMPIYAVRRASSPTRSTLGPGSYTFELAVMKTGAAAVTIHAGPGGTGNYFPASMRLSATIVS